jgi:indolepyruvate ferredoxin oxidoreductase beta subunit
MKLEIVCAGIGGRGVLLASTILIETAIKAGLEAMASDEYGMSQRGGSVVSLVKVRDCMSPIVGRENADIVLSFEESEFYRNLVFLKRGGMAIVNTHKRFIPDGIGKLLKERNIQCYLVNADEIASRKGSMQASNMALLGYFSYFKKGPYTFRAIEETIKGKTKGKFIEKNLEVFKAGYDNAV